MAYQLTDTEPDSSSVALVTFVLFDPAGQCVVPEADGTGPGPGPLVGGTVADGENWMLDTSVRIPLELAGFHRQRLRVFAVDSGGGGGDDGGDDGEQPKHVFAWLEGNRYSGTRPHATVGWHTAAPEKAAGILERAGRTQDAMILRDAAASYASLSDADFYADNVRLMESAYLRGTTVQQGSGFGGDAASWRLCREPIVDAIDRDGTFLDLGCANGLLMESVTAWAGERGLSIEPYGVDLAPGLVNEARARLPRWEDRIELGNAIDYRPADGRRFTYVHLLADAVPANRQSDLIRHALEDLVEPSGRVILSRYGTVGDGLLPAHQLLSSLRYEVEGHRTGGDGTRSVTTAWTDHDTDPLRWGHRARALVVDDDNLVVLRRQLPYGREPYHAIPGGGVDPEDASVEAALRREVLEELGAVVGSAQQVLVLRSRDWYGRRSIQHYFLTNLVRMNFADRNGPEFSDPTRGTYEEARIPFTTEGILGANLNATETEYLSVNCEALKEIAAELARADLARADEEAAAGR